MTTAELVLLLRSAVASSPPPSGSPSLKLVLSGVPFLLTPPTDEASGGVVVSIIEEASATTTTTTTTTTPPDGSCTITTSLATLCAVANKSLSPLRAMSTGRLSVSGDKGLYVWIKTIRRIGQEADAASAGAGASVAEQLQGCRISIVEEQWTAGEDLSLIHI